MPIVINSIIDEKKKPDFEFQRQKVVHGSKIDEYLHRSDDLSIDIKGFEVPTQCPMCKSTGTVVNYFGEGFHFRCTVPVCGHKF